MVPPLRGVGLEGAVLQPLVNKTSAPVAAAIAWSAPRPVSRSVRWRGRKFDREFSAMARFGDNSDLPPMRLDKVAKDSQAQHRSLAVTPAGSIGLPDTP